MGALVGEPAEPVEEGLKMEGSGGELSHGVMDAMQGKWNTWPFL